MTIQSDITSALVKEAMHGNTRAFEIIRDTIGQKPADHVELSLPDFSALDAVDYGQS